MKVEKPNNLVFTIGKNVNTNEPIYGELTPNLLVAGGTGTGKTTIINNIVEELITKNSPDELKLVIVDTKAGCSLSSFFDIPHLIGPIIKNNLTDVAPFLEILDFLTKEVEARYELLIKNKCKSAQIYNQKHPNEMPPIVVVIDEIADIMLLDGAKVEPRLVRFFQAYQRTSDVHFIIGATTSGTPNKWLNPLLMSFLGINKIILYSQYASTKQPILFPDIYDKLDLDPNKRQGYYFNAYAKEELVKFSFEKNEKYSI